MTDRRVEAANKRVRIAEARLSKAYGAKRLAIAKASARTDPAIWKAMKEMMQERQRQSVAELESLGITPMQTIILYHPKYTGITAQRRYVVRVTLEGWKRLVPVGKQGRIMKGRTERTPPLNWSSVTVTGDKLQEDGE